MKLETGQVVQFAETEYSIIEQLGRGAVSDVYLATPRTWPTAEVIIKLVRDDASQDPLKIEGVRREAEVLQILNRAEDPIWSELTNPINRLRRAQETTLKRRVIALLSSGQLETHQPFVIQEKSPPAFERFAIEGLADERRMLIVLHALAEGMALVHQHKLTLKDFEPQTKADRIRVQWSGDQAQPDLKIIDWNITGGLDEKDQDLFFFGCHSYYFLVGHHLTLDLDNQPPLTLGLGIPGWDRLTEGSRQILRRLLHRDISRRYRQANDVAADLGWWLETMSRTDDPKATSRLQDRIWQVRPQGRHDQALAVAELALRLNLTGETRRSFELWAKQAKEELEKEDWKPIAHARATLLTGAYDQAAEQFAQQQRILPAGSSAKRLACLFELLAQAGGWLKRNSSDSNIRPTPEWAALNSTVDALVERRDQEAEQALQEFLRLRPDAANWLPIKDLLAQVQANLKARNYSKKEEQFRPRSADASQPNWLEIEAKQIELMELAITELQDAQQLARCAPELSEQFRTEQAILDRRRKLLPHYQDVEKFMAHGQQAEQEGQTRDLALDLKAYQEAATAYQSALDELEVILQVDSTQYRAHLLQNRLQNTRGEVFEQRDKLQRRLEITRRVDELFNQAHGHFRRARYDDALTAVTAAADLAPDHAGVQLILQEIQVITRLLQRASTDLETARQSYRADNFVGADDLLSKLRRWTGQPLANLPGGESLSPPAGQSIFRFPTETEGQLASLAEQIRAMQEAYQLVQLYQNQGEYTAVVTTLETVKTRYPLTPQGERWLAESQKIIKTQTDVSAGLLRASYQELRSALAALEGDLSPKAVDLRQKAGQGWRQLVQAEADLLSLDPRLAEGISLFQNLPIVESLTEMRRQVELAQMVAADLVVPQSARWPAWFTEQDWLYRLRRLNDNLDVLQKDAGSWSVLQQIVRGYYTELAGYLDDFQCAQLDAARQQAQQYQFEEALRLAEAAQQVSSPLRAPLSCQEPLKDLSAAARLCLEYKYGLDNLSQELENNLPFSEAVVKIDQVGPLPRHSDTPIDQLKAWQQALRAEINWAIETEKLLASLPPTDSNRYAVAIDTCLELTVQPLEQLPIRRVEQLRLHCLETVKQIAHRLRQELEQAIQTTIIQPERLPESLLQLYWQVRWWEVRSSTASLTFEPQLKAVLNAAHQLPGQLLHHAATAFTQAKSRNDLDQARVLLVNLITLNGGLARRPVGSDFPALPSLPAGTGYTSLTAPLDGVALQQWVTQIEFWQKFDSQTINSSTPVSLSLVRETAQQLQRSLAQLKQVWHTLRLGDWAGQSSPAQLEAETKAYLALINSIEQADQSVQDNEAKIRLDGLNQAIDRIEQETLQHGFSILATFELTRSQGEASQPFFLWLLNLQRQQLKEKLSATRRRLGRQVYQAQQQQSLQDALSAAYHALSQGQALIAREHLKRVQDLNPSKEVIAHETAAYLGEGQRAMAREDFQQALQWFEAALNLTPENPQALASRDKAKYQERIAQGRRAMTHAQFELAADLFRQAQESSPESDEAKCYEYLALGRQALLTDNLNTAIEHFRRAQSLDPSNVEARDRLSEAYLRAGQEAQRKGQLRQAEIYFQDVYEKIAPGNLEAQERLVTIKAQQHQLRRRQPSLRLATSIGLFIIFILILLGWLSGQISPVSFSTPPTSLINLTLTPDSLAVSSSSTPIPSMTSSPVLPEIFPTPTYTLISSTNTPTPTPILGRVDYNSFVAVYSDPITSTIQQAIPQGTTIYLCAQAGERYQMALTYCHEMPLPLRGWVGTDFISLINTDRFPSNLVTPLPPTSTPFPTFTPLPVAPLSITTTNLLTNGDFENSLVGWECFECVLTTSTTFTRSGQTSLVVTQRKGSWDGPSQAIPTDAINPESAYKTEVWARMVTGTAHLIITLSVKMADSPNSIIFNLAGPTLVNDTDWIRIINTSDEGIPLFEGKPVSIRWYVQTDSDTADFYLEDATFNIGTAPQ